jgi:hypothetical protein
MGKMHLGLRQVQGKVLRSGDWVNGIFGETIEIADFRFQISD